MTGGAARSAPGEHATRRRQITAFGRLTPDGDPLGGVVDHGEHPASAVVRLVAEQAGVAVAVSRVLAVSAQLSTLPPGSGSPRAELHEDRVLFELRPTLSPTSPLAVSGLAVSGSFVSGSAAVPGSVASRPRVQRFAAYGFVTDPAGRVLLTRIAPGYPGAGRWHLPGGGTDFGEQPVEGLLRELHEEAAQSGEVAELLTVSHRHNPAAVGPEGYPIDWHTVRALYRVLVPVPEKPTVTEAAGGSTADAAWFEPADLGVLTLTEVARCAVSRERRNNDEHR
jgi:8-oxo-dGTP diphosphatase